MNNFPCNKTPVKYVSCCDVMDCVDIKSSDNSINVEKSECGVDLTLNGNNLGNILDIESSSCIDVVEDYVDGVLTFTPVLKASCIPDVPEDFVDARNGLNFINDPFVELGGDLIKNTVITGTVSGYSLSFNRTNASTVFSTSSNLNRADNGSVITASLLNQTSFTAEVSGLLDYTTGTNYHTSGFLNINAARGRMAYFYPIGAASLDTLKTTYITTSDSLVDIYGSQITIQSPNNSISSGALVSGKRYRILVSAGGTDFAPAGASSNAVGTEFISIGVTPVWLGSDSVKLVNGFSGNILGTGGDYGAFNVTDGSFDIGVYDTTTDSLITQSNAPTNYLVEIKELGVNDPDYYTKGLITISDDDFVRIGHHVPNSRSTPAAPPANDIAKTSYVDFRDALTNYYSASHFFEGSILAGILGTTGTPVASAQLELRGTTKGFLPNRMTEAQRLAIPSPATGLIVYQTGSAENLYLYKSTGWVVIS